VIFYLGQPSVLLGLALGLVTAVLVHNLAQALAARSTGDPAARMARQLTADPRRHFEPFGIIAMVVAGLGWGRPVALTEPRRGGRVGRYIATLLIGPLAAVALGVVYLGLFALLRGDALVDPGFLARVILTAGVVSFGVAVLHLVPLPPLDGARIMWALAPPTPGWQKARYNLEEQNYGLGALIVLLLPIFGNRGLVARIVDAVTDPIVRLVLDLFGVVG
jgi:Zn-dependent protease